MPVRERNSEFDAFKRSMFEWRPTDEANATAHKMPDELVEQIRVRLTERADRVARLLQAARDELPEVFDDVRAVAALFELSKVRERSASSRAAYRTALTRLQRALGEVVGAMVDVCNCGPEAVDPIRNELAMAYELIKLHDQITKLLEDLPAPGKGDGVKVVTLSADVMLVFHSQMLWEYWRSESPIFSDGSEFFDFTVILHEIATGEQRSLAKVFRTYRRKVRTLLPEAKGMTGP